MTNTPILVLGGTGKTGRRVVQQLRAHEYVAEQIRRHIGLRLIQPGEALPSERELASLFGVGRPTIQHALRLLEAGRLVEARRGRLTGGGVFDLSFYWSDGSWRLARCAD